MYQQSNRFFLKVKNFTKEKRFEKSSLRLSLFLLAILYLPLSYAGYSGAAFGQRMLIPANSKAVRPYLKEGERIHLLGKVRLDHREWIDLVCLVPKTTSEIDVRDLVGDWGDRIIDRHKYIFPVLAIRENSRIDVDNLNEHIRQACNICRIEPRQRDPRSPFRISTADRRKVDQTYRAFFRYHVLDDPQLGYVEALEGMLTNLSPEHIGADKESMPKVLTITAKAIEGFVGSEGLVAAKANEVWNRAYNIANGMGYTRGDAILLADDSSRFYDRIWSIQSKHRFVGKALGIGLSQGSVVLERVLAALVTVNFLEGAETDLSSIRDEIPNTIEGQYLKNAIDRLLPRIRGEVDVFTDKLTQSIMSQEFLVDMAVPAISFVAKFIAQKAATWGIPIVGKALIALDVGLFLGDLLSNNPAISKEFELAKYAKDIEAVLHQVAYSNLYRRLQFQVRGGNIQVEDLRRFDASVHLTFLSESFFWRKVATGLNSTTPVKDVFDSFARGTTGPTVAKTLLPFSREPASAAAKWHEPRVVEDIKRITLQRLQR